MNYKQLKSITRELNKMESENFNNISDRDLYGMITCQRAIMFDKIVEEEEQERRNEMMTSEEIAELESTAFSRNVFTEVIDMDQDVYDSYEEISESVDNSINDDNIEVVIAEPIIADNENLNNQHKSSASEAMSLILVPVEDYASTDFRIFGDTSKFENIMDCSSKTVTECIIAYVQNKSTSQNLLKAYENQYRSLVKYIKLLEITYNITLMPPVIGALFMARFENFLLSKKLASSTVAGIIGKLKCVMRWAGVYGAKISADLSNYKVKSTDARPKVVLTEEEIQQIFWFKMENLPVRPQLRKTFKKVRDHFLLSCYLGQRYSDTIRVDERNFTGPLNEIYSTVQKKTGNRAKFNFAELYGKYPYIVKVLLREYNYKAPWSGNLANYNRYLKKLCEYIGLTETVKFEYKTKEGQMVSKEYPKYQLISSHVARRTFITLAVKRNINTQLIKRASGHVSDASFSKYVIWNDSE